MAIRIRIAARNTAITLTTLIAAAFLFVQSQQWILRHRAEQLFSDIQAFQFRQANFADLQKFQQRWGSRAHYDGTCSVAHCSYQVDLANALDDLVFPNHMKSLYWLEAPYHLFTAHWNAIHAEVKLHNDKIWGTEYNFYSSDKDSQLHQAIYFGPHLFRSGFITSDELRREYSVTGASNVNEDIFLYITPQTNPIDIKRLSTLNFDCLTRLKPCVLARDILPEAAKDPLARRSSRPDQQPALMKALFDCDAPVELFAREAENIIEVQVVDVHPSKSSYEVPLPDEARVHVLQQLKNAKPQALNSEWEVSIDHENLSPQVASSPAVRKLVAGHSYLLLFSEPVPGEEPGYLGLQPCSAYPVTDSIVSDMRKGIAMDWSGGEPIY